jgi:putative transposase
MTTGQRREVVQWLMARGLSERRSCGLAALSRSSLHYQPQPRDDEAVTAALRAIAQKYVRYGYRRAHALLAQQRRINRKRVQRLWQQAELQRPTRRRRRRAKSGQAVPLQAHAPNHVWTYDFMQDSTLDSRTLRILTVVDEFTRECLVIAVARRFPAADVLPVLAKAIARRGPPAFVRSDNGSEFIAQTVVNWLHAQAIDTHPIDPGAPWQNPFGESFNGHFRDECLNLETFWTVLEAQVISERWRGYYNDERPHSSLDYLTPTEFCRRWQAAHGSSLGPPTAGRASLSLSAPSVGHNHNGAGPTALPH